MRPAGQALCLVLLLIAGQQGALVHELGHLSGAHETDRGAGIDHGASVDSTPSTEPPCALCPSFGQLVTPAFSHSFDLPVLLRGSVERSSIPPVKTVDTAIPTPRSRGPPLLS
ncbi:MAG TPA: hypothetical protein VME42_06275 [Steroidobacteraceae bacterium]|nr:hypothetical protein [Steroidobacteraceae bacterium]